MTTVDSRTARAGGRRTAAGAVAPLRRRRSGPHLLLGAVLVVAAALGAAVTVSRLDTRTPVVAVARAVPAGQVLTAEDLTLARVVADDAVRTVPGRDLPALMGRTAAVPLQAGALLVPGQVGPVAWPPLGKAVTAVLVKAGHAPAGLTVGSRVSVLVVPPGAAPASAAAAVPAGDTGPRVVRAEATVVATTDAEQPGTTVVSLLLADDAATRIASATGDATLVLRTAGS